jgi:hypothetical protein
MTRTTAHRNGEVQQVRYRTVPLVLFRSTMAASRMNLPRKYSVDGVEPDATGDDNAPCHAADTKSGYPQPDLGLCEHQRLTVKDSELPSQYLMYTRFQLYICGFVAALDDRYPRFGTIVEAYDDDEPRLVRALDAQSDRDVHHEPACAATQRRRSHTAAAAHACCACSTGNGNGTHLKVHDPLVDATARRRHHVVRCLRAIETARAGIRDDELGEGCCRGRRLPQGSRR